MKRGKTINKWISMLVLCTMLLTLLSGCGKGAAGNENGNTADGNGNMTEESATNGSASDAKDTTDAGQGTEPTAMGRYVETVTDLSENLSGWRNRLFRLADSSIIITDSSKPFLISKDNGVTWEEEKSAWRERLIQEDKTIMDAAVAPDHTVAVIYSDYKEDGDFTQKFLLVKPDGTEIPVEIPLTTDEYYPMDTAVADNGRIFVTALGSDNLYEVKEDGSCEQFMTVQEGRPGLMRFQGNLLIMDGMGYKEPLLYDIERGEYIKDETLGDFVQTEYNGGNNFNIDDGYEMYFFPGEEDILYIAGQKGLHRHVISGSAMEQVIDGSLCTFSNPAHRIQSVILLDNNEFLALFTGTKLVRFVYDPDMPTVPNEKIKIYSLKENSTVQQAISLYQTAHPEVFLEYEIGMEQGGSVTRDDALKNLNTKIMAGEGPDVLILDNLPLDSYLEKGLLTDLTPLLGSLSGEEELFGNIVDAMKMQDGIYAMPCEISIPVIVGKEAQLSGAKDLKGIADMTEKLREDNPGKNINDLCTEKGVMRFYSMVCAPAWTDASGNLNKDAIREFLEQTNRIYHAQVDECDRDILDMYIQGNDSWMESFGEKREDSEYLRKWVNAMDYIGDYCQMAEGTVDGTLGYARTISISKVAGFEDCEWSVMNGQSSNVFCTRTILGISAASEHTEQAQDFVKLCLGKDNQTALLNGLPVNKAAFEKIFTTLPEYIEEDGAFGWEGSSRGDGTRLDFISYWPTEEQIARLRSCVESANTAYIENLILEGAVYEEGILYLRGDRSLEDAVNNIEKKVALYMAE